MATRRTFLLRLPATRSMFPSRSPPAARVGCPRRSIAWEPSPATVPCAGNDHLPLRGLASMKISSFSVREQVSRSRRRASVLLEFAFVIPILATLGIGILEVARAVMVRQILSDAARKGCRTAVLPSGTTATATQDAKDVLTLNNISSTSATVTILVNGVSADASTAKMNDQ